MHSVHICPIERVSIEQRCLLKNNTLLLRPPIPQVYSSIDRCIFLCVIKKYKKYVYKKVKKHNRSLIERQYVVDSWQLENSSLVFFWWICHSRNINTYLDIMIRSYLYRSSDKIKISARRPWFVVNFPTMG